MTPTEPTGEPPLDLEIVHSLPCWPGPVVVTATISGLTNVNYIVECAGTPYLVRVGGDIPEHCVNRTHEHLACCAAAAAGLSPPVLYAQPNALVQRFIAARPLDPHSVRNRLLQVVALLRKTHTELALQLPPDLAQDQLAFRVFDVLRGYLAKLECIPLEVSSHTLRTCIDTLDAATADASRVFAHNDLLPSNILDDGQQLWLIDWEFAGFGDPCFDLANLSVNNDFTEADDTAMLNGYYASGLPPGAQARHAAMKAVAALREALWALVSAQQPRVKADYQIHARKYMTKFKAAWHKL